VINKTLIIYISGFGRILIVGVQRAKRNFAYNRQIEIEHLRPTDTKSFWKYIGKIGVGNDRLKNDESFVYHFQMTLASTHLT
jgi:hypothetical protein